MKRSWKGFSTAKIHSIVLANLCVALLAHSVSAGDGVGKVCITRIPIGERWDANDTGAKESSMLEADLDPAEALALAARFAEAVDAALDVLARNPEIGRQRFGTCPDLVGTRSWRVGKPFHRFIILYRIENGVLSAERLLEGHTRVAGAR